MNSVGGFRWHRQTKESRKYKQLQLQGGKGGNKLSATVVAKLLCELGEFCPITSHTFTFLFLISSHCFLSDPAPAQQAVCPGRSVRQEEQETAAEAAEEHGRSRCRPGAPADPLREGVKSSEMMCSDLLVFVCKS